MNQTISNKLRHFFHVVSNIRPIVWISVYVLITPIFAFIYWALPDSQFRIPDGAGTDYGSWLYYSIVTITTLGFGDYTPAHIWAQTVTAVEVMCGLIFLGLFLNAVGSMKSEIDVESEIEKQKMLHHAQERDKLLKSIPTIIHNINQFLAYCYALTTPPDKRDNADAEYNPDFSFNDMTGLFKPSGLPSDHTRLPVIDSFLKSSSRTSLCLDSLQTRIDLALWPDLLADCFDFVANYQMFTSADTIDNRLKSMPDASTATDVEKAEARIENMIARWDGPTQVYKESELYPYFELYTFIKENGSIARNIEVLLTRISAENE